jgi:ATP-dependent exoDNAse (exonuclease V) beta subunit
LAEGFADLVFLADDGYVLVDYKTDKTITPESYNHYQQQLGAYALILKELTGQMPSRIVLAHVDREKYTEIPLDPPVESLN